MALIQSGVLDNTYLDVDPTLKAIRGSYRPPEVGGGGFYKINLNSGTITTGLAAAGILFSFRNPSSVSLAVITNVRVGFLTIAAGTAASWVISMYATRSFSALDATGAATLPIQKGMNLSSLRGEQMDALIAISNTGTLSGGTGTDDAQPLASLVFQNTAAVQPQGDPILGQHMFSFFNQSQTTQFSMMYPLVCAQNEGFRIRNDTTGPGTADTQSLYVDVEWFEASAF